MVSRQDVNQRFTVRSQRRKTFIHNVSSVNKLMFTQKDILLSIWWFLEVNKVQLIK